MSARVGAVATLAALSLTSVQALAQTPPDGVRVEHAAARLEVIAEPRANVTLTVSHGSSGLPQLQVHREGGVIVVDGGLARPFGGDRLRCVGSLSSRPVGHLFGAPVTHVRDDRAVVVDGVGKVDYGDLPVITAHVPMDVQVATEGAVWGEIGATNRLHLASAGCGDWRVGPVRGGFDAQMTGSGDVQAESSGPLHAQLAGSGDLVIGPVSGPAALSVVGSADVRTGPVGGPLYVSVAGSGGVDVAQVAGPIDGHIASSGDVHVHAGSVSAVHVNVAGSGDFTFDGVAGRLAATVAGSGDVRIAHVSGPVSKSVMGSGEVTVGP